MWPTPSRSCCCGAGRARGTAEPARRRSRRRVAGHLRAGARARRDAGRHLLRAARALVSARGLGRAGPGGVDGRARPGAGRHPRGDAGARDRRAVVRLPARRPRRRARRRHAAAAGADLVRPAGGGGVRRRGRPDRPRAPARAHGLQPRSRPRRAQDRLARAPRPRGVRPGRGVHAPGFVGGVAGLRGARRRPVERLVGGRARPPRARVVGGGVRGLRRRPCAAGAGPPRAHRPRPRPRLAARRDGPRRLDAGRARRGGRDGGHARRRRGGAGRGVRRDGDGRAGLRRGGRAGVRPDGRGRAPSPRRPRHVAAREPRLAVGRRLPLVPRRARRPGGGARQAERRRRL